MATDVGDFQWDLEDPAGYANTMGRYKTNREWEFLRHHQGSSGPSSLRVLDIGGGSGRFAGRLGQAGHRVLVVERSAAAVELLTSRAFPGVEAVVEDFLDLAPVADAYDLALAMESLLYFDEVAWADLYRRVADSLAPGGLFVFTMLNPAGWRASVRRLFRRRDYPASTPAETTRALDEAGFSVVGMEGLMWLPVPVTSNAAIVPALAWAERTARLHRWVSRSPWVLVAARRR